MAVAADNLLSLARPGALLSHLRDLRWVGPVH